MMTRPPVRNMRLVAASLAAALAVALAPAGAGAATRTVGMELFDFAVPRVTIARGDKVRWRNTSPVDHDVRSTAPSGYFSSGRSGGMAPDDTYTFTFRSAGTFSYLCRLHKDYGMTGKVRVPITVRKLTGPVRYRVTVATAAASGPWRHQVQAKARGSSFKTIAVTTKAWTIHKPGGGATGQSYRSRLVNTATGAKSGWSPVVSAPS